LTKIPKAAAEGMAAWERARSAEDLQVGWVSSSRLLEAALDAELDPEQIAKFGRRVRRLAEEIAIREPALAAVWDSRWPFIMALRVGQEVLLQRHETDRLEDLIDAYVALEELAWEPRG